MKPNNKVPRKRSIKRTSQTSHPQHHLQPLDSRTMQAHGFLRLPSLPTRILPKHTSSTRFSAAASFSDNGATGIPALALSDAELESRGFSLHRSDEGLDLDALNDVFARVGFPRREPSRIRRALEHTQSIIWLADNRRAGGPPVAFARAAGDGVFNAVVWDVVVDPSFQGLGLGRAVMERLVADLRAAGVCNIALYAEPRVIGFYRPLGFAADPDGIKGMVYSRKKKQRRG